MLRMTMHANELILFLMGLVSLFSPPSVIGPFAVLMHDRTVNMQRSIAVRLGCYIAVTLVVFAWAGQYLLTILGVTVPALTISGGIALLSSALPSMVGARATGGEADIPEPTPTDQHDIVAVPLVFPLSIGAGMVSLTITTASRFRTIPDLLGISMVCLLFAGIAGMTLYFARPLGRWLGACGLAVLSRISGVVLTAIAVQLIAKGIRELWMVHGG